MMHNKLNLRREFERLMSAVEVEKYRFEMLPDGRYENIVTEAAWTGFKLYARAFDNVQLENGKGTYVIAKQENGRFLFTQRPHVHKERQTAVAEMTRLHRIDGSYFALFKCVFTISTQGR